MLMLIGATVVSYAAYPTADTFLAYMIVATCCGVTWSAVMPIGDGIVARNLAKQQVSYGAARSFGSGSVLLVSVGAGALAPFMVDAAILLLVCSFSGCFLAVWVCLPTDERAEAPLSSVCTKALKDARLMGIGDHRERRGAIALLSGGALILGSHSVLYAVGFIYWQDVGFSTGTTTLFVAVALAAEIIAFRCSDRELFAQSCPVLLIAVGGVAGTVRWLGLAFSENALAIVLLQLLQGATLAGVNVAIMRYIASSLSPAVSGRSFGRVAAISHGLIPLVATLVAGPLLQHFGAKVFLLSAAATAGGAALALTSAGRSRGRDGGSVVISEGRASVGE